VVNAARGLLKGEARKIFPRGAAKKRLPERAAKRANS
jgi:hypothetical protein